MGGIDNSWRLTRERTLAKQDATLFFMDTGLSCHLTRWTTTEQLKNGTVAGHMFETFVVSEILKGYMNADANLRDVWFYRDSKKRKIDLVIQEGHVLHPVEVKTSATVGADAVKNFARLKGLLDALWYRLLPQGSIALTLNVALVGN